MSIHMIWSKTFLYRTRVGDVLHSIESDLQHLLCRYRRICHFRGYSQRCLSASKMSFHRVQSKKFYFIIQICPSTGYNQKYPFMRKQSGLSSYRIQSDMSFILHSLNCLTRYNEKCLPIGQCQRCPRYSQKCHFVGYSPLL